MSDTPTGEKKQRPRRAQGAEGNERPARAGGGAKARARAAKGQQGWTATGDMLERSFTYGSRELAGRSAKRALGMFQKAGKPVEVGLYGETVTLRVKAPDGQPDGELRKLMNRAAKDRSGAGPKAGNAGAAGDDED